MSILTLSALLNTLKIPVNGYHINNRYCRICRLSRLLWDWWIL